MQVQSLGLAIAYRAESIHAKKQNMHPRRTKGNLEFWPPFVLRPLGHFAHLDVQVRVCKAYARQLLLEKMAWIASIKVTGCGR